MEQYVFVRLHARQGEESAVEEALRGDRAIAGGGGLREFSHLPSDARPAAVFHSLALVGRSRVPGACGIAAYGALP